MIVRFKIELESSGQSIVKEFKIESNDALSLEKSLTDAIDLHRLRAREHMLPTQFVSLSPQSHFSSSEGDLERLKKTWEETLVFYKIRRSITSSEIDTLRRAMSYWGTEVLELAIYGARYEPRTDSFNPGDYVSLNRIFGKDKDGTDRIIKYQNWGSRQKAILEDRKRELFKKEEELPEANPEKVRQMIAQMMPKAYSFKSE